MMTFHGTTLTVLLLFCFHLQDVNTFVVKRKGISLKDTTVKCNKADLEELCGNNFCNLQGEVRKCDDSNTRFLTFAHYCKLYQGDLSRIKEAIKCTDAKDNQERFPYGDRTYNNTINKRNITTNIGGGNKKRFAAAIRPHNNSHIGRENKKRFPPDRPYNKTPSKPYITTLLEREPARMRSFKRSRILLNRYKDILQKENLAPNDRSEIKQYFDSR